MTVLMGSARFLGATHSAWDSLGTEARSFLPAARRSFHDTGFRSRSNFGSGCNLAIAILPSQQSSHGLSMDRRRHAETVVGGMSLLYWQFLQAQCPSADQQLTSALRRFYTGNLASFRALALAASSSRFLGSALVSSERRRLVETSVILSIASKNTFSFAFEGLLKPVIFLTNWSEAARTSSSVTGGSKLKSILIFLHIYEVPPFSRSGRTGVELAPPIYLKPQEN